jgi:protein-tyrosine phosphatase
MKVKYAILLLGIILGTIVGVPAAMSAPHPTRITFVDTGNTGRSVAAEALAAVTIDKDHLDAQVISRAVNLNPFNTRPEINFVDLLHGRGINIASHTAAQFGTQEAEFSDVILTMTEAHKSWILTHFPETRGKVFTLGEYATGTQQEVLDPFGKSMDFYKVVLNQLDQMVGAAVTKAVAQH